jgi:hypothetical protein
MIYKSEILNAVFLYGIFMASFVFFFHLIIYLLEENYFIESTTISCFSFYSIALIVGYTFVGLTCNTITTHSEHFEIVNVVPLFENNIIVRYS